VLLTVFAEEESFDDIYGNLGEQTIPRKELEKEICDLMGGQDDSCSSDIQLKVLWLQAVKSLIKKGLKMMVILQQKMAKMFTSGRKRQNWYIRVLEHADSEF